MSSRDYWEKREKEALQNRITDEKEYDKQIEEIYRDMLNATQKEIEAFYGKYASDEGISIGEAKKRVSKLDIKAYERKAKKYVEAAKRDRKAKGHTDPKGDYFSDKANEEMRIYNLTMKINRLEMLKANIGLELVKGHAELESLMEQILEGRTMDELARQAGILGKTVRNNAQKAQAIVNASFHNATFSDRIWMHQDLLKQEIAKQLQSGLIQGKNARELAKVLQRKFDVKVSDAERLMRTELARVQTEAQKQSFERNGFEQYEFITNGGCCPICDALDGKHFKVEDMMPGKNAPPMHPNCRCSIAAYEDSEEYEAWLDYLDKGGTTEEWNKTRKSVEKNDKTIYTGGIPRNWKKVDVEVDDALKNANPEYSSSKQEYRRNCPNCVNAYEMRKRGFDVVAKPSGKNHYLNHYPENAWKNIIINKTTGNGYNDIVAAIKNADEGARFEVSIIYKTVGNNGHVFIAEKRKGKILFLDPQSGCIVNEKIFDISKEGETRFWRIDNAEPTDRCITSCESR